MENPNTEIATGSESAAETPSTNLVTPVENKRKKVIRLNFLERETLCNRFKELRAANPLASKYDLALQAQDVLEPDRRRTTDGRHSLMLTISTHMAATSATTVPQNSVVLPEPVTPLVPVSSAPVAPSSEVEAMMTQFVAELQKTAKGIFAQLETSIDLISSAQRGNAQRGVPANSASASQIGMVIALLRGSRREGYQNELFDKFEELSKDIDTLRKHINQQFVTLTDKFEDLEARIDNQFSNDPNPNHVVVLTAEDSSVIRALEVADVMDDVDICHTVEDALAVIHQRINEDLSLLVFGITGHDISHKVIRKYRQLGLIAGEEDETDDDKFTYQKGTGRQCVEVVKSWLTR